MTDFKATRRSNRFQDLTGKKFDRLTVVSLSGFTKKQHALWMCICICGKEKVVKAYNLKKEGGTGSCGCIHKEVMRKHGMCESPQYSSWKSMISRCTNPKYYAYHLYGGRGIKVCDRWFDIGNFIADMGEKPTPKHSIERIDVNGNYEPSNCKWATTKEQNRNRRGTLFVDTVDGRISLSEACELHNINYDKALRCVSRGECPKDISGGKFWKVTGNE